MDPSDMNIRRPISDEDDVKSVNPRDIPTQVYETDTAQGAAEKVGSKSPKEAVVQFAAGDKIDDFQLLTLLGSGAFAQVFLARQLSMERLVALKISAHRGSEPQTLAQLDHRNIVRVFDQRSCTGPSARLLYMEVVSGGTLSDVLPRVLDSEGEFPTGQILLDVVDDKLQSTGTAIPEHSTQRGWLAEASWPLTVCKIGAQLAEGLAYAHKKGVLHRDIKPANVLLTPDGSPKLADFNVSFNGSREDEDPAAMFGGSLVYMSPEQLQACHPKLGGSPEQVRETSDIFSLGVLLWELVSGRRPFSDEREKGGPNKKSSLGRLQRMMDARHYVDLKQAAEDLPSDCPESLRQVLVRCLQPRKEERYQSADEVAQALRLCLEPRCWRLLQEPTSTFGQFVLKLPVLSIVLPGLIPSLLLSWFKYRYTEASILANLPELRLRFEVVQGWVNGIAFPLGITLTVLLARRVLRLGATDDPPRDREEGRQVLLFGSVVSLILFTLWASAGVIYPLVIDLSSPGSVSGSFYLHFFISLALCGFAAIAYPYFLITALVVRYHYSALVRNRVVAGPRHEDLRRLRLLNRFHLALAALVPMLGVLLMVAGGGQLRWVLLVVSGVGLLGFVGTFALERFVDEDITALGKIAIDEQRAG